MDEEDRVLDEGAFINELSISKKLRSKNSSPQYKKYSPIPTQRLLGAF